MKPLVHASAGIAAFAMVLLFWTATLVSEVVGSEEAISTVKTLIPWGFLFLIPMLATASGSGLSLGKSRRGKRIDAKKRRAILAALNGVLVLVPSALFLAAKAGAGSFDAAFYAVQGVELIAGAANLVLLGLNIRDGFAMTGRFRQRRRTDRVAGRPGARP